MPQTDQLMVIMTEVEIKCERTSVGGSYICTCNSAKSIRAPGPFTKEDKPGYKYTPNVGVNSHPLKMLCLNYRWPIYRDPNGNPEMSHKMHTASM